MSYNNTIIYLLLLQVLVDDFDPKNEKLKKLKNGYESAKSAEKSAAATPGAEGTSTSPTDTAQMVGEKLKELRLASETAAQEQDTSAGAAAPNEPATPKGGNKTPANQKSTGKRNQGKGQGSRQGQSTAKKQPFITLKDLCAADNVKKNLFKDVPEEGGEEEMCSEEKEEVKQRMQSVPDNLLLRTGKVRILLQLTVLIVLANPLYNREYFKEVPVAVLLDKSTLTQVYQC